VDVKSTISPLVNSVPVAPFDRVCTMNSAVHSAVIDAPPPVPDVVTAAPLFAITVPATPPHRTAKVSVGVDVVPYAPVAFTSNTRPSAM